MLATPARPPRRIAVAALDHTSSACIDDCFRITPERRIGAPNSKSGVGFVLLVHKEKSFDLRYSVSNRVKERVQPARIESFNPVVTMARSRTPFSPERPYLLSNAHCPRATHQRS